MGINLSLMTRDLKDHPRWDCGRHAGDREVAVYLADLDDTVTIGDSDYTLFRPSSIRGKLPEMMRLAHGYNEERWERLVSIIESEPDYWLHIGW